MALFKCPGKCHCDGVSGYDVISTIFVAKILTGRQFVMSVIFEIREDDVFVTCDCQLATSTF